MYKAVETCLTELDCLDPGTKAIWSRRQRLSLSGEGLLILEEYRGRSTKDRPLGRRSFGVVVLPQSLRRRLLGLVHDSPLSGHMGRTRTMDRLRNLVWWPGISSDVASYVSGCEACQRSKRTRHPEVICPQFTDIPGKPFEKIQIDFVGPFLPSVPGNFHYVLAVQDVLTRFCLLAPTLDCTAETAAKVLLERWLCTFDMPLSVQSDRGPHFTGKVFKTMCASLGLRQSLSSPNHPQSNAQVERQNQLIDNVRCLCLDKPQTWEAFLGAVQYAHNTSKNATTGYSPFFLVFKQDCNRPEALWQKNCETNTDQTSDVCPWMRKDVRKIKQVFHEVRNRILSSQELRNSKAKTCGVGEFKTGERVRIRLSRSQRSHGGKLEPFKSRPYIVVRRRHDTYWLRKEDSTSNSKNLLQRHFNELERAPVSRLGFEQSSDESSLVEISGPESTSSDGAECYPLRSRKAPSRLIMDPHKKRYSSQSDVMYDSDGDSDGMSDSDGDSDGMYDSGGDSF